MTDPRGATPASGVRTNAGTEEPARPSVGAGLPFLAPTPRSSRVVAAPVERRPTPPFVPRERAAVTARPADQGSAEPALPPTGEPTRSYEPPAVPAEPIHPSASASASSAADDADAWDWGHEPLAPELEALATLAPAFTPAVSAAASAPDTSDVAAAVLESLALRLRQRVLVLDAAAAVDSDEAVLASTLAALFARRTR